jgi:hypothetical protein
MRHGDSHSLTGETASALFSASAHPVQGGSDGKYLENIIQCLRRGSLHGSCSRYRHGKLHVDIERHDDASGHMAARIIFDPRHWLWMPLDGQQFLGDNVERPGFFCRKGAAEIQSYGYV